MGTRQKQIELREVQNGTMECIHEIADQSTQLIDIWQKTTIILTKMYRYF